MTERLVEPGWLARQAVASGLPGVVELVDALTVRGQELIHLAQADHEGLLPTYEVRFARAQSGEGPSVEGMDGFMKVIRLPGSSEMFGLTGAGRNFVGLVDGDALVALCVIRERDG